MRTRSPTSSCGLQRSGRHLAAVHLLYVYGRSLLPTRCHAERTVLEGLQRNGRHNYCNAIGRLPRNLRLIYLHGLFLDCFEVLDGIPLRGAWFVAFQSYHWNRVASERIRTDGRRVLAGDLVLAPGTTEGGSGGEIDDAEAVLADESGDGEGEVNTGPLVAEDAEAPGAVSTDEAGEQASESSSTPSPGAAHVAGAVAPAASTAAFPSSDEHTVPRVDEKRVCNSVERSSLQAGLF